MGEGDLGGGLGADELELRRMLQGTVGGLQPSDGALDHLRLAVPRRRARKRQALVGAAAAVVLLGTGVPAALHVAGSGGAADASAANAGHGRPVPGDTGGSGATAGEEVTGNPSGELGGGSGGTGSGGGKGGTKHPDKPQTPTTGAADGQVTEGVSDPTASEPVNLPACTADQLAATAGAVGKPTANGTVYGTFRVANVSSADCAVDTPVTLGFRANGAADSARIGIAPHGADGPATQLPVPSAAVDSVALKPSAAYEVKFAWVPKDTCPVDGGTDPEPSTSPTEPETTTGGSGSTGEETGGTATGADADTATGTEPQLVIADTPTEAAGSVTVTHTPVPGAPTAEATVPEACAGTVYHTGILPVE
ncbi:hypothetical protein I3F58_09440 [Streptomyces sp. MUM 203J]|nr:hypothetical protein [Streptomyces sp. MUM 203J]